MKRTLAIVALTTSLMSCSQQAVPATTPTMPTETLRIYATTATHPLMLDLTTTYNSLPPVSFDTYTANYQSLLEALLNDETPYFMTNYLPADSPLWAAPIGRDGIAIISHPDTPLENLTLAQLRNIYQGQSNESLVVFSREAGSGTRAEFERMVMGRRRTTANALVAASSQNMVERVAQTPNSIGYVSIGHLMDDVHVVAVEGVPPTQENIRLNLYPLRSTIHIVGQAAPTGSTRLFFGWIQSQAGQAVVAQRYAPM